MRMSFHPTLKKNLLCLNSQGPSRRYNRRCQLCPRQRVNGLGSGSIAHHSWGSLCARALWCQSQWAYGLGSGSIAHHSWGSLCARG
jgi:hypothetical protein